MNWKELKNTIRKELKEAERGGDCNCSNDMDCEKRWGYGHE